MGPKYHPLSLPSHRPGSTAAASAGGGDGGRAWHDSGRLGELVGEVLVEHLTEGIELKRLELLSGAFSHGGHGGHARRPLATGHGADGSRTWRLGQQLTELAGGGARGRSSGPASREARRPAELAVREPRERGGAEQGGAGAGGARGQRSSWRRAGRRDGRRAWELAAPSGGALRRRDHLQAGPRGGMANAGHRQRCRPVFVGCRMGKRS